MGLLLSRGAYLLSSSKTMNCNGSDVPLRSFGVECLPQHHADNEAFGPVVEQVDIDDCELLGVEVDGMRWCIREVGPDEMLDMTDRGTQASNERR